MNTLYLVNNKEYEPEFSHSFQDVAEKQGYQFKELAIDDISLIVRKDTATIEIFDKTEKLTITKDDRVFIRSYKPSTSATAVLCFALDANGVPFNDHAINMEHNIRGSKLAQCFLLKPHNVYFPTSLVTTVQNTKNIRPIVSETFTFPLVLKLSGSKGEKVWLCEDQAALDHRLEEIVTPDSNLLVQFQEYIENTFDIRIVVFRGRVLASIARSSADGFHNNVSQGGSATPIHITDEERDLALRAAAATRIELAGVDVVRTDSGPLLFEVNKAPDLTAFNEAAGFDIPQIIAEEFLKIA